MRRSEENLPWGQMFLYIAIRKSPPSLLHIL